MNKYMAVFVDTYPEAEEDGYIATHIGGHISIYKEGSVAIRLPHATIPIKTKDFKGFAKFKAKWDGKTIDDLRLAYIKNKVKARFQE